MSKRRLEEFDYNKSDPEDEDYEAVSAPSRAKPKRTVRGKVVRRKRPRAGYGKDGSEDVSDSELDEDSSEEDDDDDVPDAEEPELNEIGRPVRKAARKRMAYEDSDDEGSVDYMNRIDSEAEAEAPPKSSRRKPAARKSLVVKLRVGPPPPKRGTRAGSAKAGNARAGSASAAPKRPSTADAPSGATRRSSRIAHDGKEPIVALTNSGNHAEVVRPGTRSPEAPAPRPLRGLKGLKKPPSAILEADEEESSQRTRAEADEATTTGLETDLEIAASREDLMGSGGNVQDDTGRGTFGDTEDPDLDMNGTAVVPESNDEEDDDVVRAPRRSARRSPSAPAAELPEGHRSGPDRPRRRSLRAAVQARGTRRGRRDGVEDTSDFEPEAEKATEENVSSSSGSESSPRKTGQENDDSSNGNRRPRRPGKTRASNGRHVAAPDEHVSDEADELAEELEELHGSRSRRRRQTQADDPFDGRPQTRKRKPVDYRIIRPETAMTLEEDAPPSAVTPTRRRGGTAGAWHRTLFSTTGPFGGAGGPVPVFGGGAGGVAAAGGVDSDSSDDENVQRPRAAGTGGMAGMTPTAAGALPGFANLSAPQAHGADPLLASLGKVKDKQALADADPLGVDQFVNFDSVGGLQGHIDQLKEMVALPLLYPEVFQRFHVTPPRGVLFHGPPGTGKTLLARALASSVSSHGRKVTFYMRKGADALSKWVGEAERQLRLLFEDARKTQPSIIFFDEIDGLAPVRSSKQDQIHSSIVSTLLALMDGMDGRGQVIVIGATNRPDSVDPALRRPGRFDREFYFPLPTTEARRKILDIHTKGWVPPVSPALKDELAELTKGYGGADLRALCTEAALNAVQRRYPQIYRSNEKLQIEPEKISVTAKDFMASIKKIVPSSERSASSGAAPLPKSIEPLLRQPLKDIQAMLAEILPRRKRLTALEEAEYEDAELDRGMGSERMQQEFERSRVFRPRLLLRGAAGMGQQYLAGAVLNHFEGLHVQSFDLPTLLGDSARSAEAAAVQFFAEVKRHRPGVIYIPNVDVWYQTVGEPVISTFLGLLRALPPTDPILLLGVVESDAFVDPQMVKDLFGFSRRNQFLIGKPTRPARIEFFAALIGYLNASPIEFPDPAERKKRVLEKLPVASPEPAKAPQPPTKEELKAQRKRDRQTLNLLKVRLQPIMDHIKPKYKRFRTGVIDRATIEYLYEEDDPSIVVSDLPPDARQAQFRPYEKHKDSNGEDCLIEVASGKLFYNMEIVTIEHRLSNGYYKRPRDFLADVKKLTKDAKTIGDQERLLKASELQSNVEVDVGVIEGDHALVAECEAIYNREVQRERGQLEKARTAEADGRKAPPVVLNVPPANADTSIEQSSGAIVLEPTVNRVSFTTTTPSRPSDNSTLTNTISDLSYMPGHHRESNGTSVPSRAEDTHVANSDDTPTTLNGTQRSSFGPSAQTRSLLHSTGAPNSLQQRLSVPGNLSQRSAVTPLAEGSNPQMYSNSASTTSSDKRNTGSTIPQATPSTFSRAEPEALEPSAFLGQPFPGSQLPDTQEVMHSSAVRPRPTRAPASQVPASQVPPSQVPASRAPAPQTPAPKVPTSEASTPQTLTPKAPASQIPAVPLFNQTPNPTHRSAVHNLLNVEPEEPTHPPLATDAAKAQAFQQRLIDETSACSVEQLEQVYSALMSEIWATRGKWDRVAVIDQASQVLDAVLGDMKACQDFGPSSADMDALM